MWNQEGSDFSVAMEEPMLSTALLSINIHETAISIQMLQMASSQLSQPSALSLDTYATVCACVRVCVCVCV